MKTVGALMLAWSLAATGLPAQMTTTIGETTVTLDIGFGIRAVPPSRVTVPVGERLRLMAPPLGDNTIFRWTKNGKEIAGESSSSIVLGSVQPADAGTYAWEYWTPNTLPRPSQQLVLGVGPADRLLNISTRGTAGPGADQSVIVGFVVAAGGNGKRLILRAVGPSLAAFNVPNPLRAPVLRIFDAAGRPYTNGYVYPAVVGGLTYEEDLAASLARIGAFPIPAGTRDVVLMMPFLPGGYTVQATSEDGTAGAVLVEVYEVPWQKTLPRAAVPRIFAGSMPPEVASPPSRLIRFRNAFISGALLLAPLVVTIWAFSSIINIVGGTFRPLYEHSIPESLQRLPFFWDFMATVVVVLLVTAFGYLSSYVLGKYFFSFGERAIQRIPGVGGLYNSVKQIVTTFGTQKRNLFTKVVMVEFPRKGMWVLGFLTNKTQGEAQTRCGAEMWTVFVPTTPNPTSGFLVLVPRPEIIELEMSVGDGMKMIISGGAVVPPWPQPQPQPAVAMAK